MQLKEGIPSIKDYSLLKKTDRFLKLESYSSNFLEVNDPYLDYYKRKWSKDPLHQWSREYEYPYVYQKIEEFISASSSSGIKILDAGSGITFFPFMLMSKFPNVKVTCCDYDGELSSIYKNISKNLSLEVDFFESDIHSLPFDNSSFDIIYCISVLEHTRDYSKVLDEFKRILKPNGKLIITFDISVDGVTDISISQAENLLKDLNRKFNLEYSNEKIVNIDFTNKLTTLYFKNRYPELLPWKFSFKYFIKELFRFKFAKSKFFNLSFYCLSASKSISANH